LNRPRPNSKKLFEEREKALLEVHHAIVRAAEGALGELLSALEKFEEGHEIMTAVLFDETDIGSERAGLLSRQAAVKCCELARETPLYTGLWRISFSGTRSEVWVRVQREQKVIIA